MQVCSNPMVAMTLLSDLEHQHRNRGQRMPHHQPPSEVEVNENCPHFQPQSEKSTDEVPEDLRICCNPGMEEIQRSPIKPALKRTLSTEDNNGNISEEGAEKKRQRVENIVTSICQPRSPKPQDLNTSPESQKNKRKQFVPQQHGSLTNGEVHVDVVSSDDITVKAPPSPHNNNEEYVQLNHSTEDKKENALLKNQIKIMSEQLQKNQQITQELTEKMKMERYELMTARLALHQPQVEMESCIRAIRAEINQAVKMAFKEAFDKHSPLTPPPSYSKDKATSTIREPLQRATTPSHNNNNSSNVLHVPDQMKRSNSAIPPVPSSHVHTAPPAHHTLPNPLLPLPLYYGQALTTPNHFTSSSALTSQLNNNMMSAQLFQAAMENELIESQLYRDRDNQLNKKKRTKVTDTRLSPRNSKSSDNVSPSGKQEVMDPGKLFDTYGPSSALFPAMNASSMAAMQNALLTGFCGQAPMDAIRGGVGNGAKSPTNESDNSDHPSSPDMNMSMHPALPGQNVTLTPLHLRKAKLMFFYVRYPSSVLLKNYFCDVHFNKNNTAQLVKWFSNFREFYYIQMEKYARQFIAEGLSADQVEVTTDSELYKILNLHYNRNNQIEVPRSFLDTIQTTLREFIKAIVLGKDREQSWKKPIYKVIARLDDLVPEYFKSQDWMEQLSD